MDRDRPLDPPAVADLPHGESLARPATLPADYDTLEDLDPRAVAFSDPHVHAKGVSGPEVWDVGPGLRLLKLGNRGVHRFSRPRHHHAHACERAAVGLGRRGGMRRRPGRRQPTPTADEGQWPSVCHIFASDRETGLGKYLPVAGAQRLRW